MKEPEFIVVDLFCGAGGTTTGFEMTDGLAKVIACVNHDANAIKSHWLNHPDVVHFEEDIRTLNLDELLKIVNKYRLLYPNAKLLVWISLECTNFSKAKGGLPRDADSRTLADDCKRYIVALNPDIIQIENVVEFMAWGDLDKNGKPVSRNNGKEWMRWRKEICELGYVDEWKQLNAADFGAYTSRNRLFGMFSKDRDLLTFPEKTHSKIRTIKVDNQNTLFSSLEKWKPVKEVLDLEDDGNSIFGRTKDLCEKTLERIYAGLVKFVANGDESFLLKYNSTNGKTGKHVPPSINEPCPVVSTQNRIGVIKPCFLIKYNNNETVRSIDTVAPTITTKDKVAFVNPCFLTKYHGTGTNISSIDKPSSTLSTKDRLAMVQAMWIDRNFTSGGNIQSIDSPAGALLSTPKINLVKAEKFILNSNFNNVGNTIDEPSPVITASRKHHYLVNPQWGINSGGSIDKPCFTLIARMDKTPPYIVTTDTGEIAIEVYETDTPAMIKIKQFMAAYSIGDIKMRMLKIPELLKIQGFPNEYKLQGTQTEQKKFIGNSVHPLVVKKWIEAIAARKRNLIAA